MSSLKKSYNQKSLQNKSNIKNDYSKKINEINIRVKELAKYGVIVPSFSDICHSNDNKIIEFILNQYTLMFEKQFNAIEFLKYNRLINKGPAFSERFSFKNDIDILKIIQNKKKQSNALMLNFINAFTKILQDKGMQFIFSTQTIDLKFRHTNDINIEKNIHTQKDILNNFHRNEKRNFKFFKQDCENREFIRAIEFHEDMNLHEHTIKAFDNSLEHLINYIITYEKNRKSNIGVGRCELVVAEKYKNDIIKHFKLKKYTDRIKNSEFHYNENHFSGKVKNGDQLCIKFFNVESDKKNSGAIQIAKYLVSYLNEDKKDNYKFIFNNLKIKNITNSQALFSKYLYGKIFKNLNRKDKKLDKYKDMYEFTKAYNDIVINFKYINSVFNNSFEDKLIEINEKFNIKINDYKDNNEIDKMKRIKKHYNRFLKRHNEYFKYMPKTLDIEFVKEKIDINVKLSTFTLIAYKDYKKLKHIDNYKDFFEKELNNFCFINDNEIYEEQENKYLNMNVDNINNYICQDIMLENIKASKFDRVMKINDMIISVNDNILVKYKENDNKYIKYNTQRLEKSLNLLAYGTLEYRKKITENYV
ncbi:MAG: hypothetical protein WC665_05180 [Sulfurimonas sp.]|jgi:hypothetical protein